MAVKVQTSEPVTLGYIPATAINADRLPDEPRSDAIEGVERGEPHGSCGVRSSGLNVQWKGIAHDEVCQVRRRGPRRLSHINVEQIAWMFRPAGARHTVIRLSGSPDAQFQQCLLTKNVGVTLARVHKLNDAVDDQLVSPLVSVNDSQAYARHFKREAHDALGLRIESLVLKKIADRHGALAW